MHTNRRTVLKGIGAGATLLVGGVAPGSARGRGRGRGDDEGRGDEDDDEDRGDGDGEAGLRVAHASPDAPAVDVTVNDDALTLFEDVSFGESSGYAVVPAGSYDVEIRAAASGDEVDQKELTLEGGGTYTVFAEGYLSPDDDPTDEAFGLVATLDKGAPPRGN